MNKEILEAVIHIKGAYYDFIEDIVTYMDKYRWHDLRKYPNDLPATEGHFNVCVWLKPNDAWGIEESYIYDTQYFCERFQTTPMSEVIAWKEIEPFEREE